MRDKIASIVRQVVMEYLQPTTSIKNQKNLFILLDYNSPDPSLIWDKIIAISNKHRITLCISERWINVPKDINSDDIIHLKETNIELITEAMQRADILLFPTTNYSLLSKLALTIDDDLTLWIAIQMQLDGKDIILISDQLEHKGIRHLMAPATVVRRIQAYLRKVQADGVTTVSLNKLEQWLESSSRIQTNKRPLILARHIQEIAIEGEKELTVPEQSLITPMGWDKAKELGVTINKMSKEKGGRP